MSTSFASFVPLGKKKQIKTLCEQNKFTSIFTKSDNKPQPKPFIEKTSTASFRISCTRKELFYENFMPIKLLQVDNSFESEVVCYRIEEVEKYILDFLNNSDFVIKTPGKIKSERLTSITRSILNSGAFHSTDKFTVIEIESFARSTKNVVPISLNQFFTTKKKDPFDSVREKR